MVSIIVLLGLALLFYLVSIPFERTLENPSLQNKSNDDLTKKFLDDMRYCVRASRRISIACLVSALLLLLIWLGKLVLS